MSLTHILSLFLFLFLLFVVVSTLSVSNRAKECTHTRPFCSAMGVQQLLD